MYFGFKTDCYIIHVNTSEKDENGYYVVKQIAGPFDYIIKNSTNRIICGKNNNIIMWDNTKGKIWEQKTRTSLEYLKYISIVLSGARLKFLNDNKKVNEKIYNSSRQHEAIISIFLNGGI